MAAVRGARRARAGRAGGAPSSKLRVIVKRPRRHPVPRRSWPSGSTASPSTRSSSCATCAPGSRSSRRPRARPRARDRTRSSPRSATNTRPTISLQFDESKPAVDADVDRARDRDPPRLEPADALQRHEALPHLRRRDRAVALPDAARALADRRQVAEPWWYPPDSAVGQGGEAGPAGPGQPARHALDGPVGLGRRHPRHARRRPRSATPPRTAASACTSPRPSGSSTTSRSGRRSSSSPRELTCREVEARRAGAGGRARGCCSRCSSGSSPTGSGKEASIGKAGAGLHAQPHRQRRGSCSSRRWRQGRRDQLLGVVVRPVQAGGARPSPRLRSGGRGASSCSAWT